MENRRNELEDLQNEILQLNNQLKAIQAQLYDLYLRVQKLSGPELNKKIQHKNQPSEKLTLENFIGLRLIHLVGMVVLIIGISIGDTNPCSFLYYFKKNSTRIEGF